MLKENRMGRMFTRRDTKLPHKQSLISLGVRYSILLLYLIFEFGGHPSRAEERVMGSKDKAEIERPEDSTKNFLKNKILHKTLRHMFGFDETDTAARMTPHRGYWHANSMRDLNIREGDNFVPVPPYFMMELYRNYSQSMSYQLLRSWSRSDTVRSFFPYQVDSRRLKKDRGKPFTIIPARSIKSNETISAQRGPTIASETTVFIFNFTSIPSSEDLMEAEIRLDGIDFKSIPQRDSDSSHRRPETQRQILIAVYRMESRKCTELSCVDMRSKVYMRVGKTVSLNSVTDATWSDAELTKMVNRARRPQNVLVVKFETYSGDILDRRSRIRRTGSGKMAMRENIPRNFEIVDMERLKRDPQNHSAALSQPHSITRLDDEWFDFHLVQPVIPILITYCKDSRAMAHEENAHIDGDVIWRALENITTVARKRVQRSTSNVAADTDSSPDSERKTGQFAGGGARSAPDKTYMVVEKRSSGNWINGRQMATIFDNKIVNDTENSPMKNSIRRRRKKRKCAGKKRKSNPDCKRSRTGKARTKLHPSLSAENGEQDCTRKSLHVDFADIGWSDWIISPKFFDAYYCTGRCELLKMQETKTTNHAIIQAVVTAIGANKNVPPPCCVPDKLLPLSVLFFDRYRNVVLKVYPNMSVETCSCR